MYLLVVVRSRGISCSFKWVHLVRDDLFSISQSTARMHTGHSVKDKKFAWFRVFNHHTKGNSRPPEFHARHRHRAMVPITDYERERQERIAKNRAILASLDIPTAKNGTKTRGSKPAAKPISGKRKRRASQSNGDADADSEERPSFTRRTSARLQQRV